jgi:hypothetical protein
VAAALAVRVVRAAVPAIRAADVAKARVKETPAAAAMSRTAAN